MFCSNKKESGYERRKREIQESKERDRITFVNFQSTARTAVDEALAANERFALVQDHGYSYQWRFFRAAVVSVANERADVVESVTFNAVQDVHFDGHALLTLKR